jgi:hypothetical protein
MSKKQWYSAKLRFAMMVSPEGGDTLNDTVIVFKAKNFKDAFARGIAIGEKSEEEYLNGEGNLVSWKLMEMIHINIIRSDKIDGAEVHSELFSVGEGETIPLETVFNPKDSNPSQTM